MYPGMGVLGQQRVYGTSEVRIGPEWAHEPAKGVVI